MSIFGNNSCCSTGCRSRKCSCSCGCTSPVLPASCVCECSSDGENSVAGAVDETQPQTVRALLNTVIDSCCVTDDICREITFSAEEIPPCSVEVGTAFDVDINGDVTFREVTRDKDDCVCVSTVRYNIPIRIYVDEGGCGCSCSRCLDRNLTVIRSARLCCTANSLLTAYNSKVIAASAVVSEVCCDRVTVTVSLLFRSCLQQTLIREYTWTATPVCESNNCYDARSNLLDNCDTVCGCTAGYSCPSCG